MYTILEQQWQSAESGKTANERPLIMEPDLEAWAAANVRAALVGSLTTEASDHDRPPVPHMLPPIVPPTTAHFGDAVLEQWLEQESKHLFNNPVPGSAANCPEAIATTVLEIVCDERWCNAENRLTLSSQHANNFINKVMGAWKAQRPIQFVLPAFPSKVQNPFRCNVPQDHVDLGDVALLVRLGMIASAISQIYPFGAEWIIDTRGSVYAPIFQTQVAPAHLYVTRLRDLRQKLGLDHCIHFLELEATLRRWGPALVPTDAHFQEMTFGEIVEALVALLKQLRPAHADVFARIERGMRQNINTQDLLQGSLFSPDSNRAELWAAIYDSAADNALTAIVEQRSERATLEYTAVRMAAHYTRLLETLFPSAIRATNHARGGWLTTPHFGAYPWTGRAYVTSASGKLHLETLPLFQILAAPTSAFSITEQQDAFFFQPMLSA